jgi:hypothetical protein
VFSIGAAAIFPDFYVDPHAAAAAMAQRLPDATRAEVQTAAHALYGPGLAARVLSAWTVAEYERRTGLPF